MLKQRKTFRVLVVDDSNASRHLVRDILGDMGLEVVEADNGADALEIARKEPFDLVVTDVNMPGMDGYDLCEALKNDDATQTLPVIILSTRDSETDIETGFSVGAAAYVSKHNFADLPGQVSLLLDKHGFIRDRLVLVVDDSRAIRKMVAEDLRREGFKVQTVSDGTKALRILDKGLKPDIIVTDLEMPRMGGLELIREINGSNRYMHIPVVVMSTHGERSAMLPVMHAGAASFIAKPFRGEQLAILLELLLSDQVRLLMSERRRLESKERIFMAAMTSLINALEARDGYTRGHSDSVAEWSVRIGAAMGFSEGQLERLKLAALLHDIGKIGVRDDVLLKPGRLTDEEYEHIKRHPSIALSILKPLPDQQEVFEAAAYHHERWNGHGYPNGLAGEDIPLLARIVAVADVFDALTSDRPYRKGMDKDKAVEIIREGREMDFCPQCVDAFLHCMEENPDTPDVPEAGEEE